MISAEVAQLRVALVVLRTSVPRTTAHGSARQELVRVSNRVLDLVCQQTLRPKERATALSLLDAALRALDRAERPAPHDEGADGGGEVRPPGPTRAGSGVRKMRSVN